MSAQSHKDLTVWRKSVDLACDAYDLTRRMPKEETYRISAQVIRASTSIAANIAEGNGRGTRRDYAHFVSIALGSAAELETFLIIIGRLNLAPNSMVQELLERTSEVGRMLNALRARLAGTPSP